MTNPTENQLPTIGGPLAGGYYAGRIRIDRHAYALIVAPKAAGEHAPCAWINKFKAIPGAQSYNDGLANTTAMAEAGSKLARWARGLRIGDFDNWYLPSQDELEIIYRNLKPTDEKNNCWARSGINLSSTETGRPYIPDSPTKTTADLFQSGNAEALDTESYWSSMQFAAGSGSAWFQNFNGGDQCYVSAYDKLRARAVRRLPI